MKRLSAIIAASLVVMLTDYGCGHLPSHGWVTLIDGNTGLDNCNRLGGANWRAEDGAMQADKSTTKGSSVLVSKTLFKDFELYAEFWADHDTNSGLCIRCINPGNVRSASAYEAQIRDRNPDPSRSAGALLPLATVHVQDGKYPSGAIGLQQNAGLTKWRKLAVREL